MPEASGPGHLPKFTRPLRSWASNCLDRLLPRHCALCGQASGQGNLCGPCHADLPRLTRACPGCALPSYGSAAQLCGQCLLCPQPWLQAVAALVYCYPVDWLVRRFKFNRDFSCGQVLGLEMLAAVGRCAAARPDALVPVPLHRLRHFGRTFNQAEVLARQLGRSLGLPVHDRLLLRTRRTSAQSGLDATGRKRNIRGAFRCRHGAGKVLDGAHVALIDDVMTTGATLTACVRELRRAGVGEVSLWVVARAPPP